MPDTPIDPQLRPILDDLLARSAARAEAGDVPWPVARAGFEALVSEWNRPVVSPPRVEDHAVEGPYGRRSFRLYHPGPANARVPALVYFHGGGWVVGSPNCVDAKCRLLAVRSGVAVLSYDYVLAPEHPFPAPLEDCLAFVRRIARDGAAFDVDPSRLAVGGDSAGANLALASALECADDGPPLRFCLLLQGVYSMRADTDSHRRYGAGGFGLTTADMQRFWRLYLGDRRADGDWRVEPLHGPVARLPPTHVVTSELDALRDDGRQLAARLRHAGVAHTYREYPGLIHGFTVMVGRLDAARHAVEEAADALARALAPAALSPARPSSAPG